MKARSSGLGVLVFVALVAPSTGAGAADAITTDRPDVVESSLTVGRGRFQIETSIARERDKDAGAKTTVLTTPTLLRLGVSENLELRLESEGYVRAKFSDPAAGIDARDSGYADLSPGLKWHALDGEGARPSVAVLLHADIDSGSRPFRGEGIRPSLRTPFEWELQNDFSLGVMPGIVYDKTDGRRHASGILAVGTREGMDAALPLLRRSGCRAHRLIAQGRLDRHLQHRRRVSSDQQRADRLGALVGRQPQYTGLRVDRRAFRQVLTYRFTRKSTRG